MIFTIDLDPQYILSKAGYKKIKDNEWVKWIDKDRFHAIIVGYRKIDLHFDKTINGGPRYTYHSSPPKDCVPPEVKRIRKII